MLALESFCLDVNSELKNDIFAYKAVRGFTLLPGSTLKNFASSSGFFLSIRKKIIFCTCCMKRAFFVRHLQLTQQLNDVNC